MFTIRSVAAIAIVFITSPARADDSRIEATAPKLAVIVNARNPMTESDAGGVASVFRADRQFWSVGVRITLVLRATEDAAEQLFQTRVVKSTHAAHHQSLMLKRYRGALTVTVRYAATDEEVIDIVTRTPSAIGYVLLRTLDSKPAVRTVATF